MSILRIKQICAEKGISIKELAEEKLGIRAPTLSDQINGNPRLDTLIKIADALEVHITELFEPPGNIKFSVEIDGEITQITENDIVELINRKRKKCLKRQ